MPEEIYDPRERLEIFLNAIRTGDVEDLPDPQTREEMYLLAIASKSALPDTTDASVGDALVLDEDKKPVWAAGGGGGGTIPPLAFVKWRQALSKWYMDFYDIDDNIIPLNKIAAGNYLVIDCDDEMHTSRAYNLEFNQGSNQILLFSFAIDDNEDFIYKKLVINATTGENTSIAQRKATLSWSDY